MTNQTDKISEPPGAAAMMQAARKAVPVPVDQFLIQAGSGLIRVHFFDSAGNHEDPVHRTSIVLGPEQALALKEVLTDMFRSITSEPKK